MYSIPVEPVDINTTAAVHSLRTYQVSYHGTGPVASIKNIKMATEGQNVHYDQTEFNFVESNETMHRSNPAKI